MLLCHVEDENVLEPMWDDFPQIGQDHGADGLIVFRIGEITKDLALIRQPDERTHHIIPKFRLHAEQHARNRVVDFKIEIDNDKAVDPLPARYRNNEFAVELVIGHFARERRIFGCVPAMSAAAFAVPGLAGCRSLTTSKSAFEEKQ